ncbi:MAG: hypothetical protein WC702_01200 [Patescibacteria group bacterium]|jgi:hypothetical protein
MLMLLAITISALAGTYHVNFPIVSGAPTNPLDDVFVLTVSAWDLDQNQQNGIYDSSWRFIKCEAKDGDLYVHFTGKKTDWPTSWPQQVTCSGYGNTLVVHPVSPSVYEPSMIEITGDDEIYFTMATGITKLRTIKIPDGDYDVESCFAAHDDNDDLWSGVTCDPIASDDDNFVRVYITGDAAAGTGTCVIPGFNNTPDLTITINLDGRP